MWDIHLPEHWDNWIITEEIGVGAYGRVYKAEMTDERTGETILSAIKIIQIPKDDVEASMLYKEYGSRQEVSKYYTNIVTDLVNEIQTLMALKGRRNIVQIEDYHVERAPDNDYGWLIYIRMEYLQDFSEYLQLHEFQESDVIRLGIDICKALEECEKVDIIHRDIKPDNILVTQDGHFKLGDFGVSRKLDVSRFVHSVRGTIPFMPPEVYYGKAYDQTVDIYSLGLVLFRLLNRNRDPFVDLNRQIIKPQEKEIAAGKRMEGCALPAPVDASDAMAAVIAKACAYTPKDRYPSAASMREALESINNYSKEKNPDKPPKKKSKDRPVKPPIKGKTFSIPIVLTGIVLGLIISAFLILAVLTVTDPDFSIKKIFNHSKETAEATSQPVTDESTKTQADTDENTKTQADTDTESITLPTVADFKPKGLDQAEDIEPLRYKGHIYAIFNYKKLGLETFDACENFCEKLGGHLAVINTEDENNKVYNYLAENERDHTFIGYTNEGDWKWRWVVDAEETYCIWAKGQPSRYDKKGREEHYAQYNGKDQGALNDAKFGKGSGSYRFLCEWDLE